MTGYYKNVSDDAKGILALVLNFLVKFKVDLNWNYVLTKTIFTWISDFFNISGDTHICYNNCFKASTRSI